MPPFPSLGLPQQNVSKILAEEGAKALKPVAETVLPWVAPLGDAFRRATEEAPNQAATQVFTLEGGADGPVDIEFPTHFSDNEIQGFLENNREALKLPPSDVGPLRQPWNATLKSGAGFIRSLVDMGQAGLYGAVADVLGVPKEVQDTDIADIAEQRRRHDLEMEGKLPTDNASMQWQNVDGVGSAANFIGGNLGNIAGPLVPMVMTGGAFGAAAPVAGAVEFGLAGYDAKFNEAFAETGDLNAARNKATVSGLTQAALGLVQMKMAQAGLVGKNLVPETLQGGLTGRTLAGAATGAEYAGMNVATLITEKTLNREPITGTDLVQATLSAIPFGAVAGFGHGFQQPVGYEANQRAIRDYLSENTRLAESKKGTPEYAELLEVAKTPDFETMDKLAEEYNKAVEKNDWAADLPDENPLKQAYANRLKLVMSLIDNVGQAEGFKGQDFRDAETLKAAAAVEAIKKAEAEIAIDAKIEEAFKALSDEQPLEDAVQRSDTKKQVQTLVQREASNRSEVLASLTKEQRKALLNSRTNKMTTSILKAVGNGQTVEEAFLALAARSDLAEEFRQFADKVDPLKELEKAQADTAALLVAKEASKELYDEATASTAEKAAALKSTAARLKAEKAKADKEAAKALTPEEEAVAAKVDWGSLDEVLGLLGEEPAPEMASKTPQDAPQATNAPEVVLSDPKRALKPITVPVKVAGQEIKPSTSTKQKAAAEKLSEKDKQLQRDLANGPLIRVKKNLKQAIDRGDKNDITRETVLRFLTTVKGRPDVQKPKNKLAQDVADLIVKGREKFGDEVLKQERVEAPLQQAVVPKKSRPRTFTEAQRSARASFEASLKESGIAASKVPQNLLEALLQGKTTVQHVAASLFERTGLGRVEFSQERDGSPVATLHPEAQEASYQQDVNIATKLWAKVNDAVERAAVAALGEENVQRSRTAAEVALTDPKRLEMEYRASAEMGWVKEFKDKFRAAYKQLGNPIDETALDQNAYLNWVRGEAWASQYKGKTSRDWFESRFHPDVVRVAKPGEVPKGKRFVNRQERTPQTDTPFFKRWFGKSQVVRPDGTPLVVYKGMPTKDYNTGEHFTEIERKTGFPTFDRNDSADVPVRGFFSDNPVVAEYFVNAYSKGGEGAGVYPVYLRIERPYVVDVQGKLSGDVQFGPEGRAWRDAMRSGKYDGSILLNTRDEGNVYVITDGKQVKSAIGNNGEFSPDTPNILKAERQPAEGKKQVGGWVEPREGNRLLINLTKHADASTLFHELVHVWQQDLPVKNVETIRKWLQDPKNTAVQDWLKKTFPNHEGELIRKNADGSFTWTRAGAEAFVRMAEDIHANPRIASKYIPESIRPAFEAMRDWLANILARFVRGQAFKPTKGVRDAYFDLFTPKLQTKPYVKFAEQRIKVKSGKFGMNPSILSLTDPRALADYFVMEGMRERPAPETVDQWRKEAHEIFNDPSKLQEALKDVETFKKSPVLNIVAMELANGEAQRWGQDFAQATTPQAMRKLLAEARAGKYKVDANETMSRAMGQGMVARKEQMHLLLTMNALSEINRSLNKSDVYRMQQIMDIVRNGDAVEGLQQAIEFARPTSTPKHITACIIQMMYNNVLYNPMIWAKNVAVNTLWFGWQPVERGLTAGLQMGTEAWSKKQRTVFLEEVVPLLTAGWKDSPKHLKTSLKVLRTGVVPKEMEHLSHGKFEEGASISQQNRDAGMNALEHSPYFGQSDSAVARGAMRVFTIPQRILRSMDLFAQAVAFDAQMAAQQARKAATEKYYGKKAAEGYTAEAMREEAKKFARYATFTDAPGDMTRALMLQKERTPIIGFMSVPFVNTLVNLTKRSAEFVPGVGMVAEVVARSAKPETRAQQFGDARWESIGAKQLAGATLGFLLMQAFANGTNVTGARPTDPREAKAFDASGKFPYSFYAGGRWWEFKGLGPFGPVLSAAAESYARIESYYRDSRIHAQGGNAEASVQGELTRLAYNMRDLAIDNTLLNNFGGLYQKPYGADDTLAAKGIKSVGQKLSALVPMSGLLRNLGYQIEAYENSGRVIQPEAKATLVDFGLAVMPLAGAFWDRPQKLDVWGEPVEVKGRDMWAQWLPIRASKALGDPIEGELARLIENGAGYYPSFPSKKLTLRTNGAAVEIPEDLYRQYAIGVGKDSKAAVARAMTGPVYQNLPKTPQGDLRRSELIKDVVERVRAPHQMKVKAEMRKLGLGDEALLGTR